ncbi:MAG TPA: hypothetical protein PLN56_09600 [Methanoregulaceae archaeon]|nr:hypothetical protein [Methanoregulaceae archaeon]HRT52205.1 hypothetical protein [Anaerohalosphaeraceae bacterium]
MMDDVAMNNNSLFRHRFTRIVGVSERRRLPRLGKIRLGVKAVTGSGKEYPREVDYFVVPPEVAAVYGERPKSLDVMFPINDLDTVFPQALKYYGSGRGLKCIGNGVTAMSLDENTQAMVERSCPCSRLEKGGGCMRRASLMVLLPKVSLGGVYQIDMSSWNSIVDINSGIDYIQALIGRFAMVPLILSRVAMEVQHQDGRTVHYPLRLLLAKADESTIMGLRSDNQRVLEAAARIAIAAPDDSNPAYDVGIQEAETEDDIPATVVYKLNRDNGPVEPVSPVANPPDETDKKAQNAKPGKKKDENNNIGAKNTPFEPEPTDGKPVSSAQQAAIVRLAMRAGFNADDVIEKVKTLSFDRAAKLITALQTGDTSFFGKAA